jgi:hypothetical protein
LALSDALPASAEIDDLAYEIFPSDRSSGRVSVKGVYSMPADLFSDPAPPARLLNYLSSNHKIFDREVEEWWSQNKDLFPGYNGRLAEFERLYEKGTRLPFNGELPYIAVIDGIKIDSSRLEFDRLDGSPRPPFGYLVEDGRIEEIASMIVDWRGRKLEQQAVTATPVQDYVWIDGEEYSLEAGKTYRGKISSNGIVFQQPVGHCTHAQSEDGKLEAEYVPAGPESNPWQKTRVRLPNGVDQNTRFNIWVQVC